MSRISVALPAAVALLSFTVTSSSTAQNFTSGSSVASAESVAAASIPRVSLPQNLAQTPATADPVIVVRPQLTDEEMGDLYMIRKDYREAALVFKRLSDAAPQNAVYFNKLGISLHQQGALTMALKYYERAVKVDPRYADAQNNVGTVWYQRKRYGKAIRAYQKAINMRKDMPVLYSNLAYAYFEDKKYEESLKSFREALALDPKLFEQNGSRAGSILQDRSVDDRGRFYFMLAKSFAESGNYERCILYLRKAKEEGYATFAADLKKDQDFAAVMKDPGVLDLLAPKPDYVAEP